MIATAMLLTRVKTVHCFSNHSLLAKITFLWQQNSKKRRNSPSRKCKFQNWWANNVQRCIFYRASATAKKWLQQACKVKSLRILRISHPRLHICKRSCMNRWRVLNYPHSRGFKDYYSGKYDESFVDYRRYIHKSDIAQSRNLKTHFMDDLYGCDDNKKLLVMRCIHFLCKWLYL